MMSDDTSSGITTTSASTSSPHSSQQQERKLEMDMDNTQAVQSLLSMSTTQIVMESETTETVHHMSTLPSNSINNTAPSILSSSKLVNTEEGPVTISNQDKPTNEVFLRKPENGTSHNVGTDESQGPKESSVEQTVPAPLITTESNCREPETISGDLTVLPHQEESSSASTAAVSSSTLAINQQATCNSDSTDQPVPILPSVTSPNPGLEVSVSNESVVATSSVSCITTVVSDFETNEATTTSVCSSSAPSTGGQQRNSENVDNMGIKINQTKNDHNISRKTFSQAFPSPSERVKNTLECSFTESDDSDVEDPEKSKKPDDGFFRITFDSDDDSKPSSENSDFLTCSVCGKELPETAVAEGGKEMCNTCKLVRTDPEEIQPKIKRGRKKAEVASTEKIETDTPVKKSQKKTSVDPEEPYTSVTPVRKSTRKRISTIVIEEVVNDSEDEDNNDALDDNYQDADYTQLHRKSKVTEKKEKRSRVQDEITKSKYAQELNLTPVVKSDPDGKDDVIITHPEVPPPEVINVEQIISNAIKYGNVKRKKGRPKGSKNKPKLSKEFSAVGKESKRDMKFNKRWHRGRGPVPDANPDATDGMWSCEFCGKAFPIRRNFLAHRRKHSGRHKCDECGETFECNSKLQRHIRRHRGEKPFACHLCPKAYSENMWLQRHLATHLAEGHAPQPKPYQCNICGRQYTHKGTMIYHVKTHTETKFYQCDVCGKQFTHRSSLECHIKTHTGEKPYVCEVCGKRFADRSVQLRHTRSHSGDKPYKCVICDKGFTQSGTLNIHMRMHTTEKPYKCKVCDMGFMKRCDLSKHSKCHVGEMLSKQANLITCRVNEGRGADIQKKAAQILIDAYGEKKDDGTIEIKTRQFEQQMESESEEITERVSGPVSGPVSGSQVSSIVKPTMELPVTDPRQMDIHLMGRPEPQLPDHHQLQHEDIQRRAMEYIIMKRQELEQQEMERIQILHQPMERSTMEHVPMDRHVIEHQTVEVVTEQHQTDRQIVEQQIERHVEQHAAQRQLLEQVEGQVLEQQQASEGQQIEEQRLEQMSPQQQAIWICKYN